MACNYGGKLPPISALAFELRASEGGTLEALETLTKASLLDKSENQHGQTWKPHNWGKRQYISDTSTERVKRFRNGAGNVTGTPSESEQNRTEQNRQAPQNPALDQEVSPPASQEKKEKSEPGAKSGKGAHLDPRPKPGAYPDYKIQRFEELWDVWPKKAGYQDAKAMWNKAQISAEVWAKIHSDLLEWKRYGNWAEFNGRYCPRLDNYLAEEGWKEDPPVPGWIKASRVRIARGEP